jgi:CDGSH iron-sulfur domain-containing protein 3
MGEPVIAQKAPYMAELAPGDYFWCACGRSKNQPFCDGSHKGSEFSPVKFTIKPRPTPQTVWMCGCKRSKHKPFCDGTHNKI